MFPMLLTTYGMLVDLSESGDGYEVIIDFDGAASGVYDAGRCDADVGRDGEPL